MCMQTDKQTKEAYIASILVRNKSEEVLGVNKNLLNLHKGLRMARKEAFLSMLKYMRALRPFNINIQKWLFCMLPSCFQQQKILFSKISQGVQEKF